MGLLNQTQQQYHEGGDFGGYQFITLKDIINNFMLSYVGEDKIISKIKRTNVVFYAQRALQELSYDTLRVQKSWEIDIPPTLVMALPQDYVNYTKISWLDDGGTERVLYPTTQTSNPRAIIQDDQYNFTFDSQGSYLTANESETWKKHKSGNTESDAVNDFYLKETYDGKRYGSSPENMNSNGSFYIDPIKSNIHFSGNIIHKTITLKYISDGLATDDEMKIHKLAEEAMYKCIAYYILEAKANTPEYLVLRYKKDKFASVRKAKLRLSNIKLTELSQSLRGKSKQIKH